MNDQNPLPLISASDGNAVPVFNCQVILTKADETGKLHGRVANLAGISAAGNSERDVLTAIMKEFKTAVQKYSEASEAIPFVDPPETPQAGEVERFIPVHL